MQHCAPDSVSAGFGDLPLKYIYVNGTQTAEETTQKLPSGERLDGRKSYLKILQHFTTNSKTPNEIYELGEEMLNKLYSEVQYETLTFSVNVPYVQYSMKVIILPAVINVS